MSVIRVPWFMGSPIAGLETPEPAVELAPALPDAPVLAWNPALPGADRAAAAARTLVGPFLGRGGSPGERPGR